MLIYFINVPLIEMAAREREREERRGGEEGVKERAENGCTLLTHITGARRKFLLR